MTERFETYADAEGLWRWRWVASNGRIIADGAEGYASRRNVRRAVLGLSERILAPVSIVEVEQ